MGENAQKSWFYDPQEESVELATEQRNFSVGFLKKNTLTPKKEIVIPPIAIKRLVENEVEVSTERFLGKGFDFIDLDYADMGATIVEEAGMIVQHSNIVVQLAPFSTEELLLLKHNQIIISATGYSDVSAKDLLIMQEKNITAISFNFVKNVEGTNLLSDILENDSLAYACGAMGELVVSLILPIIFNNSLRYAIQTAPVLLNAIYCYKGKLTNLQIADNLNLPYTDLLMLCWNWN